MSDLSGCFVGDSGHVLGVALTGTRVQSPPIDPSSFLRLSRLEGCPRGVARFRQSEEGKVVDRIFKHASRLTHQAALGHLGWLRGAIGGALGIGFAGVMSWLLLGSHAGALPLLVAPLGASAVLVFAVPASPLAQPWSVIGGDLISAAIGLGIGHLLGAPVLSASFAVGLAIAAMSLLRCLHPPGGACALLCALGAAGHDPWGLAHWFCIAVNVWSLVAAGWLINNLTGHPWPHRVPLPTSSVATMGVREALERVLADWNEVIDADIDDLTALFEAVERQIGRQPHERQTGLVVKAAERSPIETAQKAA